jgi:hypothetical protein
VQLTLFDSMLTTSVQVGRKGQPQPRRLHFRGYQLSLTNHYKIVMFAKTFFLGALFANERRRIRTGDGIGSLAVDVGAKREKYPAGDYRSERRSLEKHPEIRNPFALSS